MLPLNELVPAKVVPGDALSLASFFSTTTWVAIPAWSHSGNHSEILPLMHWNIQLTKHCTDEIKYLVMASSTLLVSM